MARKEKFGHFKGVCTITDFQNKLVSEVLYDPAGDEKSKASWGSYFKSKIKGSKKKDKTYWLDEIKVTISKLSGVGKAATRETVCSGGGSYMSHLQFEGQIYWKVFDPLIEWRKVSQDDLLDSDCTNRKDKQSLLAGDIETAEVEKIALEELQRHDAKLRAAA